MSLKKILSKKIIVDFSAKSKYGLKAVRFMGNVVFSKINRHACMYLHGCFESLKSGNIDDMSYPHTRAGCCHSRSRCDSSTYRSRRDWNTVHSYKCLIQTSRTRLHLRGERVSHSKQARRKVPTAEISRKQLSRHSVGTIIS